MSLYYCENCDDYKDNDYSPCMDLSNFTKKTEDNTKLICDECALELEEDINETIET